jgi:acetylornithine deacetylase/succinyl-diaminopimelate desuccinylase-like protein
MRSVFSGAALFGAARMAAAAAIAAFGLGAARPAGADTPLSAHDALARELLAALIEIDTTQDAGSTTQAAEMLAKRLRDAGFPAGDVQVLEEVPRKGNLIARLRGKDPKRKPLLLLAHLDVVAADPADWSVPPFTFLERDGHFWGRGTTDDKDECAIHVANLIRLRRENFVPERDIVVALTADEEGGPNNGVAWLLAKHRPLVDAALALNEGGGGALLQGRRLSNQVQASEKIYQDFSLEVTDPGGHSSMPGAQNAIYRLSDALLRVRNHVFPVRLNEVTRRFFARSADQQPPELAQAMRGLLRNPPDAAAVERLSAIPNYNARLRTTCTATRVDAGHAKNALPQRARANVNCRILPDESIDQIEAALRGAIADEQVTLQRVADAHSVASPPSPLTPGVLAAIEKTTEELWPDVPVIPTMSTGATDGLFLRKAGIPVYGVSGVFGDIEDVRAHGRDERVLVSAFFEGREFLYRLTKRLGQASDAELGIGRARRK